MPEQTRIVVPGPDGRSVRTTTGQILHAPDGWVLVPPGDAGLTRRIKAAGPTWTVQEKVGRKLFSRGVWVAALTVEAARSELAAERSTPQYARRRAADAQRRERDQAEYVQSFRQAVLEFLAFHPCHTSLAEKLALAVAEHATPVGSGTVARTERIPIDQRAEAAVIAWMRHRTTAYEHMTIPRVKGKRREVRRLLAGRSKVILDVYRAAEPTDPARCPLQRALNASTNLV